MGWIGGTIGFWVGSRFGALAGILGAVIGNKIGNFFGEGAGNIAGGGARTQRSYGNARGHASSRASSPREREIVFLTAVGAMMAKLAKADGHVDESEIAAAEQAFERLGLTPGNREICIRAFRAAKADYHTIFDYAESFAAVVRGVVMRELMYDITTHSALPLVIVRNIGIFTFLVSIILGIVYLIRYLTGGITVPGWTSIIPPPSVIQENSASAPAFGCVIFAFSE